MTRLAAAIEKLGRPGRALGAGAVLFFLLGAVVFALTGRPAVWQPIAFNHSKHIENGAACTDCHVGAEAEVHATIPGIATCAGCHQESLGKSAEEQKLVKLVARGGPLRWTQLTRVPPDVFFSHRRHVQIAQVKCEECHGAMQKAVAPPREPFRTFTMDSCIECHSKAGVRMECNDCHR